MTQTLPDRWLRHSTAGAARTVLATLVGLLVWTVLPVVLGWQPSVVMSGSMAPAIRVGDVVLTRDVPADQLQPGHVLLVEDPGAPGTRVLHRYDHQDDDGGLVLRGDANQQQDSAPVAPEDVWGVGVLRVPWVGMPYVWGAEGRAVPVGLTALGIIALVALAPVRERQTLDFGLDREGDEGDEGASDPAEASHARAGHAVVTLAVLVVAAGAAGVVANPASATFTDTVSVSAHFTAGTWDDGAGSTTEVAGEDAGD